MIWDQTKESSGELSPGPLKISTRQYLKIPSFSATKRVINHLNRRYNTEEQCARSSF